MLVVNSSGIRRVEKARFSSFVRKVFSCGSLTVLQSQFINIGRPKFVIILLKHVSSEGFGSKYLLILIVSTNVLCFLGYGLENKCSLLRAK
jgi:hypothetical protein